MGLSYQSDLADLDDRLLEDDHDRYLRKVPGLSGYAIWSSEAYEISFEALAALRSFRELESDRNRPSAWNLEFVHFYGRRFSWALRLEGSRELADAPRWRGGLSLSWRLWQDAALTVDYLHGSFRDELALSEDDEPYESVEQLAAQFSMLF